MLGALKSVEKNAVKTEQEFYDTSGVTEGKDDQSMSDGYLKHFKEFIEQHKHGANQNSNEDQPLGQLIPCLPSGQIAIKSQKNNIQMLFCRLLN